MIFLAPPDPVIHEPAWHYKGPWPSETTSGAFGSFVESYPTSLTMSGVSYHHGSWWAADMATMRRGRRVSREADGGPRISSW